MLQLKYLFENKELAKKILSYWTYDEKDLDQMLSYYRISANAVYPFYRNGKVCFLRFAPFDEKEERNILGEIEFLNYLNSHDYHAMVPVLSINGNYIEKLITYEAGYYACVFEQVDGKPIDSTDYSEEIMLEYGRSLARLQFYLWSISPKHPNGQIPMS